MRSIPRSESTAADRLHKGSRTEYLASTVGYLLFAWVCLRLSPSKFWNSIGPDPGDPFFNLAILRWVSGRALHGFSGLWDPTFFYPVKGALALSDHLLLPAQLEGLLEGLGLTPAASYNTLLLLAFGGSALAAHWVLRQSGVSRLGAIVGALVWSYSGFRWTTLSHIQLLFAPMVPLTLWTFDRLLSQPQARTALAFLAAYLGNLLGGAYLAYMIHLPLLVLLVVRGRNLIRVCGGWKAKLWLLSSAAAAATGLFLVFRPYLTIGRHLAPRPRLPDVSGFLVTTKSYFSAGPRMSYAALLPPSFSTERGLWLGIAGIALALIGVLLFLRDRQRLGTRHLLALVGMPAVVLMALIASDHRFLEHGLTGADAQRGARPVFRATMTVVLLAIVLFELWWRRERSKSEPASALEPWWRGLFWIGISCLLMAHVSFFVILRSKVPGLESIRDPGRFMILASFVVAAFAGRGADALLARFPRSPRLVGSLLICLTALELTPRNSNLDWQTAPTLDSLPPEYRWIRFTNSVKAIVELPMLDTWREAKRMYLWSLHQRAMVNGYSGYLPPRYVDLQRKLQGFPEREITERLTEMGVTHVVVHLDQLSRADRKQWTRWKRRLETAASPWMVEVMSFEHAVIYELGAHGTGARQPAPV